MAECPEFTTITADTSFITIDNVRELVPDTFSRTVGTVVGVGCRSGYEIVGVDTFECLPTRQWSYSSKPRCVFPSTTTEAPSDGIDDDTKVLIGIVCGVAALIIIILVAMVIAVWYKDRKRKRLNEAMRKHMAMRDRPDSRYRSPDGYSMGRDSMPPPPYRSSEKRAPSRSRRSDYDDGSQLSRGMYLPGNRQSYKGSNSELGKSKKRPQSIEEEYEQTGSRPYVREWIRRSTSSDYDLPSVHGRSGYRESSLWRNA